LLSEILKQHLSTHAAEESRKLLAENDAARAKAAQSGNPGQLFMMSASDEELTHFRDTLAHEGNPALPRVLDGLIESRQIYQKNMNGSGFESNRQRALLMKRNFMRNYEFASEDDDAPAKVILKFGGEHTFKGFNPLHNNDLGNLVSELADAHRAKSVHILLLGLKGKQLRFAGIGRPFQAGELNLAEDKDSDFLYLKPVFDRISGEGMSLFDLRAFRNHFSALGPVDREMERLILGNDFLIIIPNAVPSTAIQ
jgi:hypothetical protein